MIIDGDLRILPAPTPLTGKEVVAVILTKDDFNENLNDVLTYDISVRMADGIAPSLICSLCQEALQKYQPRRLRMNEPPRPLHTFYLRVQSILQRAARI
jgi:hypothetical protein